MILAVTDGEGQKEPEPVEQLEPAGCLHERGVAIFGLVYESYFATVSFT